MRTAVFDAIYDGLAHAGIQGLLELRDDGHLSSRWLGRPNAKEDVLIEVTISRLAKRDPRCAEAIFGDPINLQGSGPAAIAPREG